jgi:hypothetical protein
VNGTPEQRVSLEAMSSYPTKSFRRTALAPGILGAIVLLAGLALLDNAAAFFWIKTVIAILAAIVCVYAWQSKQWWWLLPLGAVLVVWNPVWPIPVRPEQLWLALQYVAVIAFIVVGILIKVPNPDDKNKAISAARNRR